jgi:hypothetical protein
MLLNPKYALEYETVINLKGRCRGVCFLWCHYWEQQQSVDTKNVLFRRQIHSQQEIQKSINNYNSVINNEANIIHKKKERGFINNS